MRVMFVGDICLGEYYLNFGHGPGTYARTSDVFANIAHILSQADFVGGNLEAPITRESIHEEDFESAVLKADPSVVNQLEQAGFRVLQLANNHTVQHGDKGFEESVTLLSERNIHPVGLKGQPLLTIEQGGLVLGFLAASDVPDNTDIDQTCYQALDETFLETVRDSVSKCDHTIVMLHWGLEASTKPLPYQRELAAQLREMGVSAIIGSHPHLFYEIEGSERFVAAYSLGNFVFDLCWDNRLLKSGILDLEFTRNGISGRVWPVALGKDGSSPTPAGAPVNLQATTRLYDLGERMANQQIRKVAYFALNFWRGRSAMKARFITGKLRQVLKSGR